MQTDVLTEPAVHRWMRFGLPAGMGFFLVIALALGVGFHPLFALFVIAFVWLISQSVAMNLLTAHRIQMVDDGMHVWTLARHMLVPWTDVQRIELVDRRDQASPRRLARVIASQGRQFLVFDSIHGFDSLLERIERQSRAAVRAQMEFWKRLLLLQWGV